MGNKMYYNIIYRILLLSILFFSVASSFLLNYRIHELNDDTIDMDCINAQDYKYKTKHGSYRRGKIFFRENKRSYIQPKIGLVKGRLPPPDGDWIITGLEIVENSTLIINGSIIVESGGTLILNNSEIYMNLSYDREHGIEILAGGNLTVRGTLIESYNHSSRTYIHANSDSYIDIQNSEIRFIGSSYSLETGGICILTDNATIVNNTLYDMYCGVYMNDSKYTIIAYNKIENCFYYGINAKYSSKNDIYANNITNCTEGIHFQSASANISNNYFKCKYGLYFSTWEYESVIHNNTFEVEEHAIWLLGDSKNEITYNKFIKGKSGIYFDGYIIYPCENNKVYKNTFVNVTYGIILDYAYYTNITNNTFQNCGIFLKDKSIDNIIENNTVNGKPLVYLVGAENTTITDGGQVILYQCKNITVKNLDIGLTSVGIELYESPNCNITQNKIIGIEGYNYIDVMYGVPLGIYLRNSDNTSITQNNVSYYRTGIKLVYVSYGDIHDNFFKKNKYGLYVYGEYQNNISENIRK